MFNLMWIGTNGITIMGITSKNFKQLLSHARQELNGSWEIRRLKDNVVLAESYR